MSNYSELLKDPRWQKKRLEVLERDNWSCVMCGDTQETLHVHHKWYKKGIAPWEYNNPCLATLCDSCHKLEHKIRSKSLELLAESLFSRGWLSEDIIEFSMILNNKSDAEVRMLLVVNQNKTDSEPRIEEV